MNLPRTRKLPGLFEPGWLRVRSVCRPAWNADPHPISGWEFVGLAPLAYLAPGSKRREVGRKGGAATHADYYCHSGIFQLVSGWQNAVLLCQRQLVYRTLAGA